jgi:dihydrofolate synthase/folylpolyglutamate synthase
MTALLNAVRSMPEDKRPGAVVFSCLADKEPEALTSLLRSVAPESPIFVPTIADNPRAASGTELVRLIGTNAQEADTLPHALEAAYQASHGKPVLICGSLYLLSEFFAMHPELLTPQS